MEPGWSAAPGSTPGAAGASDRRVGASDGLFSSGFIWQLRDYLKIACESLDGSKETAINGTSRYDHIRWQFNPPSLYRIHGKFLNRTGCSPGRSIGVVGTGWEFC